MGWEQAKALMATTVAGYFDTVEFTAVAMRKPPRAVNASDEPDPTRPGFTFHGTLESAPESNAFSGARSPSAADRSLRQVSRVCLTALATDWPWRLRSGDRVQAADALYQVAAPPEQDGTSGRVAIWLNRISL